MKPDRRGIALPLALFVLIAVGALVGGTFFLGRLEQDSGRNTLFAAQAREAAEAGVSEALAGLEAATLESTVIGAPPLPLGTVVLRPGVSAITNVRRLTGTVFLVRAEGRRLAPGGIVLASRALGALVELAPAGGNGEPRVVDRGWFSAY
ncbi:MAG TPA: hypothetical protein VF252_12795 [Gemmatimonadales bacterium]